MNNRWEEIVALAREVEHARSAGAAIDPAKAKRLASLVLVLENDPPRAYPESTRGERVSSP